MIFALIIHLVTVKQLVFTHLLIQNIASMRFIDNNQVIVGNRRHRLVSVVENTLYHALNGCHLNAGFFLDNLIFKFLDIVNIIKGHKVFQSDLLEYVLRLFTKRISVNKEKDSAETFRL